MITIEQARFDLRDHESLTDAEVTDLIARAAAVVSDYLKRDPFDDAEELPGPIETAIRMVVVNLFEDPRGESDPMTPGVRSVLMRSRDPALA